MSGSLLLLAPLALCAGGVLLFLFRASPRATFVVWAITLFFVPIWIGATVGFFWAAITLVTLAAIAANMHDLRLTVVDGLVAAFALLAVVLLVLQLVTMSATVIAILQWVVPYAWGRIALVRVGASFIVRTIATVATAAAALALIEFATGVNPFVLVPGPGPFEEWAPLQQRASFVRAEGAFGHSIALGASLAMSTAFVIAARWRPPVMLLSLAVVIGAVVVTFSRIGLITAALTIALSIVLLPGTGRGARWTIGAVAAVAVAIVVPFLGDVFDQAGDEAAGSASYRSGLLSLLSEVQLLGSAGDWSDRVTGGRYLGTFSDSVDNTFVLIALRFGWIPVLLVALAFVVIAAGLLRRRSDPASIAVAAQLPALLAVALITQFGTMLWFLAGVAITWQALERDRATLPLRAADSFPSVGGPQPDASDARSRVTMSRMKPSSDPASRR